MVYVLDGQGTVGLDGHPVQAHQTAVLGEGDTVTVRAESTQQSATGSLEVLVLGGRPIRETVAHYGPFVMNTESEIRQAFEDFQAGRLGTIPVDVL
jgi:redox-sensitive bicupin YhaK (pirin superfamily)